LQVVQPPPPLAAPAAEPILAAPTTARKVKVRVKDQLLLIPLPDPDRTVQWLRGKGEQVAETSDQDFQFLCFGICMNQKQEGSGSRFFLSRHCNADPDPAFHFNVDPDPAFHSNADLVPAPHESDGNLRPMVYRPSRASF
jgi:hypothetical protein